MGSPTGLEPRYVVVDFYLLVSFLLGSRISTAFKIAEMGAKGERDSKLNGAFLWLGEKSALGIKLATSNLWVVTPVVSKLQYI